MWLRLFWSGLCVAESSRAWCCEDLTLRYTKWPATPVSLSVCLPVCLWNDPQLLSACLSVCLPVCLCLSVCLFVCWWIKHKKGISTTCGRQAFKRKKKTASFCQSMPHFGDSVRTNPTPPPPPPRQKSPSIPPSLLPAFCNITNASKTGMIYLPEFTQNKPPGEEGQSFGYWLQVDNRYWLLRTLKETQNQHASLFLKPRTDCALGTWSVNPLRKQLTSRGTKQTAMQTIALD